MNDLIDASPLLANGRWWEDSRWREAFDVFGEDAARAALAQVARYITERSARGMTWRSRHPFLFDYWQRAGRDELVLLGLGLLYLQPRRMRGRLRAAEHYIRAKAEIRVGLLLASLGMQLVHEPDGRDQRGPDWLCRIGPSLALRIEVKCPEWSGSARLRSLAAMSLMNSFVDGLGDTSALRLDTGIWLTIAPTRELVEAVIRNRTVDEQMAGRVAGAAGKRVAGLGWPLDDGRYDVDGFGHVAVRRGAGDEPRLHFSGDAIPIEVEHEAGRLRDCLQEAAQQLKSDASGANVIAIDCANDGLIPSRQSVIEEILREPWASHIAGVLIVNDVSETIRRQYAIRVLRGQSAHAALDALAERVDCGGPAA